jgi:hypothetical protein
MSIVLVKQAMTYIAEKWKGAMFVA